MIPLLYSHLLIKDTPLKMTRHMIFLILFLLSSSLCSPPETASVVHDYVNVPRQRDLVHEESFESTAPLADHDDSHDGEDEDEGEFFQFRTHSSLNNFEMFIYFFSEIALYLLCLFCLFVFFS